MCGCPVRGYKTEALTGVQVFWDSNVFSRMGGGTSRSSVEIEDVPWRTLPAALQLACFFSYGLE